MRKVLSTVMVMFLVIIAFMFLVPVDNTQALDVGKPFGLNLGMANDTLKLDMSGSVRKLLDVDYSVNKGIEELKITGKKSEFLTKGELGLTVLGTVRPFVSYEGLSGSYINREWGVDTYIFGNNAFGIGGRISQITRDTHFDRERMWAVGIQGVLK